MEIKLNPAENSPAKINPPKRGESIWKELPGVVAAGIGFAAIHLLWEAGKNSNDPDYRHVNNPDPDHFIPGLH